MLAPALTPFSADLGVLESYCVKRDLSSDFVFNYLATAPLFGLNVRPTSKTASTSTVLVGQFDCLVLAFDPYDLSSGPLYAVSPHDSTEPATMSSDYLSMTEGGTLVFEGWRDDKNEYAVFAVRGVWDAPYVAD